MEGTRHNTRFRNQLLFKSTRSRSQEIEQDRFKQYTDLLLANDPTSNGYADSLDQVLDALSSLIKEGYTKEAQHLSEYTLNRMEDLLASIDSDADMVALRGAPDRLQNVYLKACRSSRPDADALAKQLLEWRLNPH